MGTLALNGQGVEGAAVRGQSRKPLATRGEVLQNGIRCYRFIARFDVKASISAVLPVDAPRLVPTASLASTDEVVCETAYVHSLENIHSSSVSKGSGAHQANFWSFSAQTAVTVTVAHEQLQRGFEKRMAAAKQKSLSAKK